MSLSRYQKGVILARIFVVLAIAWFAWFGFLMWNIWGL